MDEILYLEPDEEITSVIDKIKQSQAMRLGLVVPRDATLLQSVVNLKLLQKEVTNLGKEIAIITSDKIGRNLASKVGLTVYESVKNQRPIYEPSVPVPSREEVIEINDAPKENIQETPPKGVNVHHFQEKSANRPIWRKENKSDGIVKNTQKPVEWKKPKIHKEINLKSFRIILLPILTIVILLILIGAFLILPKVSVKLKVQASNFEKTVDAQISGDGNTNLESKTFGGTLIDISQEKEEKFPTTGKKNLGGKATGTITIYNNLDNSNHNFSAGAKLSSSSKTFVLKNNVIVPGAGVQSGKAVPGTVSADIEAENAGEEYNVNAGRFTIVGLAAANQEFIYGQSSKDLTGGFSKEVQVVSENDYKQAKDKITKELNDNLNKDLKDKAGNLEILDSTIQTDIVEETPSAKVDTEAQEFTLKIKERMREIVFVRSEFDKFILSISEKQIPSTQMITRGPNDTISPQIKEKKYDQNLLSFSVNVSAKISNRIDTDKIKDNLLGKSKAEAENYLKNYDGLNGYDINYIPSWWPLKRIPSFRRNLDVSLDYLEPAANTTSSPTPEPSPSPEASQ